MERPALIRVVLGVAAVVLLAGVAAAITRPAGD
jgi:hypothetical protein